jgi:hypothetical protein
MSVNPLRVKQLSGASYDGGTVVYQMCRDIRAHDNDALLFAQELAEKKGAQLITIVRPKSEIKTFGYARETR